MSTAPKRPLRGWWSPEDSQAAINARQQATDNAMAGLDPMSNALRMGTDVPAELDGLDSDAIKRMSMSTYAEIRRRAGLPGYDPYSDLYADDSDVPGTPRTVSAPEAVQANAEVPDFGAMTMDQYAAYRQQLGIGQGRQYGRGILDGTGTDADAQAAAARAQAGRTALSNANVVEPPRIERQFRKDDMRNTRSVAERFGTPGNAWQGR